MGVEKMKKVKNKMRRMIIAISVAILISPIMALTMRVFAEGRSFALSPMSQKVVLTPGETYEGSIDVINPSKSDSDFHYLATIGAYGVKSDENSVDDYASTTENDITKFNQIVNWIELKNDRGTLAPNETATISFYINVPEDAPGGGQYATILVQEDPQAIDIPETEDSNIKEIMQMASIIYAEIAGDTIREGEIIDNNIPAFLLNGQFEATSMVKNNGNVHTDAEYILQVWPLFSDEEICTNEEDPAKSLILPETKRYHAESCTLTAPGIYKVKQIVRIFGEESIAEKTIIYCPIWLLFIILAVIAGIIIWVVMRIRARNNKKSRND